MCEKPIHYWSSSLEQFIEEFQVILRIELKQSNCEILESVPAVLAELT